MHKLRVAICDDESEYRAILHGFILQMAAKHIDYVDILIYESGEALLADYPKDLDILLLDIMLKDSNGIDIARQIRKFDEKVNIVFITNMPQFAIEGYKIHAYGYLLKPLSYDSFVIELSDLFKRIMNARSQRLVIKSSLRTVIIPYKDIKYIETQGRRVLVHSQLGNYEYKSTMTELEVSLSAFGFIRCHHAYLINAGFVTSATPTEIELSGGEHVPVSRHKRADCLDALSRFVGGKI